MEFASVHLSEALIRLGRGPEAVEVLLAARRKYDGDWEARLDDQLTKTRDAMGLDYYLHDTRLSLPVLIALLVLVLGWPVWLSTRSRRVD